MKKLLKYMKGYYKECVIAPLFKLFEASLELLVPFVMSFIIDVGIASSDKKYVLYACLLLVLFAAVGLIASVTAQYFSAKAAIGFSSAVRRGLMAKVQRLSYSDLDTLGSSAIITGMTSDINQVQSGVNLTLRLLLRSPFVVFGAMVMAFVIDPKSALIFVAVIAILSVIVFGIMLITIPMYKGVQSGVDRVTRGVRENLTGVRVIRAFCNEEREKQEFSRSLEGLNKAQKAVGKISALMNPVTLAIINIAIILLLYVGAVRVDTGKLTQGEVVALYNYMSLILVELIKLANLIISITKSLASASRISSILEIEEKEAHSSQKTESSLENASVVFENVSMKYKSSSEQSLENISFSAKAGATVGIIGGTGSGKTTLVNLIPKFYELSEGRILIGGVDISTLDEKELRSHIGIVPQKAVLFTGTIRSNLLWGNENASDEELYEALRAAQALDVVASKEKGLDEPVNQGGTNFSGGQRQRLTIARALVKKPEILILDDSASALDYATDAALRHSLSKMENSPTVFIVSQRAASVLSADIIIVLDDGKSVGVGTHSELIESCEVYREIYYSQFGGEAK